MPKPIGMGQTFGSRYNGCAGMHGRGLQEYLPVNNTGKNEAIAVSDARAKATADSIMDYIHRATPTVIRDLVTPVGNYTGQLGSLSSVFLAPLECNDSQVQPCPVHSPCFKNDIASATTPLVSFHLSCYMPTMQVDGGNTFIALAPTHARTAPRPGRPRDTA